MDVKYCKRCLFDSDIAEIGEAQCNYCSLHDELEKQSDPADLQPALDKIRYAGGQFNCIIGISGGLDSSTLLYAAVRHWGLRPLVIHFDNGWNDKIATGNMERLVERLGVNAITYRVDKREYDELNQAFLMAGTPDADIPNDIAMTKLMYKTADMYGISWILNGHDFRTEGSTPAKWTYMDAKYIKSVYSAFTGRELQNYPLFTFWDQVYYAIKGIKQIRPFHYGFNRVEIEDQMKLECGWESYGAKHCENVYTEFVGAHLLPLKFKIDKRRVYLSARIRSGDLKKETALKILENSPAFNLDKLGPHKSQIMKAAEGPTRDRKDFDRYNFKRYPMKGLVWLLVKLKVMPYTVWAKYCR